MITLGLDPHPGSHTVVALDKMALSLGHLAVPNTPEGLIRLHEFGARFFRAVGRLKGARPIEPFAPNCTSHACTVVLPSRKRPPVPICPSICAIVVPLQQDTPTPDSTAVLVSC